MNIHENVLGLIGHTPLLKLGKIARDLPVTLLAKLESLSPGGSVKDRIGLAMIEQAERDGLLQHGGTIIEATAGNTGAGLALVAAVKGYRCIFVMPDKMSDDKVNLLRAYGAEVVITPTNVPPDSPDSYNGVADRLAREIPGSYRPQQFANPTNPLAHYTSTGPEIWEDSGGRVDVLVAGMGTGGTISGTGKYLKEKNPSLIVVGADPEGSILSGDSPKSYLVEGIGEDFIPATFNRQIVDEFIRVNDRESFNTARRLAREEGLLVGGSAGTAAAAALKYANRAKPGAVIVAILPDSGRNYLGKIFSDRWMAERGLLDNAPAHVTAGDVLAHKESGPLLVTVKPEDRAIDAEHLLERHGFSQLPVVQNNEIVGSLHEITFARLLSSGANLSDLRVSEIMGKPLPQVDEDTDISEPYRLLLSGHTGVVITQKGRALGLLSRIDLVHFWSSQAQTAAAARSRPPASGNEVQGSER